MVAALGFTLACTVGERPDCCPAPGQAPIPAPATPPAPEPEPPVAAAPVARPVVIGVVLPRSGPAYLEQYGDLLMEGIRLAADRHRGPVELLVLDDSGLVERDSALVAEALERGALAIIGPMLSAGVHPAAAGRSRGEALLISPTASDMPGDPRNAYTLNGVDLRGPRALAEYAASGGLRSAAILYPAEEDFSRQAWAFRRALEEHGGRVTAMVPYDAGTTTFGEPIRSMVAARPDVVYLPLSAPDVQVIAPQLAYYGLHRRSVVIMGNESWTDDDVLRLVSQQFTDGVIASTPSPRLPGETGWDDFTRVYEERYRRTLDNPFPALGYDAMLLILSAIEGGAATPADVAAGVASTRALRAATGVISVDGGRVTRAPFIYRIRDGSLTAPPAPDLLRFLGDEDRAPAFEAPGAPDTPLPQEFR